MADKLDPKELPTTLWGLAAYDMTQWWVQELINFAGSKAPDDDTRKAARIALNLSRAALEQRDRLQELRDAIGIYSVDRKDMKEREKVRRLELICSLVVGLEP